MKQARRHVMWEPMSQLEELHESFKAGHSQGCLEEGRVGLRSPYTQTSRGAASSGREAQRRARHLGTVKGGPPTRTRG